MEKQIYSMIRTAKRHKDYDEEIVKAALAQDAGEVLSISTPEARKLYNFERQVFAESCRMKAFTRLEVLENGVLYAKIEAQHYVEDQVIAHFADRFPKMNIVIESARGVFFSVQGKRAYSKGNAQEIIAKIAEFGNPEIARQFSDFSNGLWEQYYSAQFISQRENLKLRNARVPKRYHSKGTTPDAMQSKLF